MHPQVPSITPTELTEALTSERPPLVLDVREADELATTPFPGALHIPLGQLQLRHTELPTGQPIAVLCRSGTRSAYATSFLISEGFEAVNIADGILACQS